MNDKKNIDRLFQEKFKDFEAVPDAQVWLNIETALKEKKTKGNSFLAAIIRHCCGLVIRVLHLEYDVQFYDKN